MQGGEEKKEKKKKKTSVLFCLQKKFAGKLSCFEWFPDPLDKTDMSAQCNPSLDPSLAGFTTGAKRATRQELGAFSLTTLAILLCTNATICSKKRVTCV